MLAEADTDRLTEAERAVAAFGALMSAAAVNGWQVTDAALPSANRSMMAATPIGPYCDPLFDA